MSDGEALQWSAGQIIERHGSYVESDVPFVPIENGDILKDALNQFGLAGWDQEMQQLFTPSQFEILLQIGRNLGGGLDPDGKFIWLLGFYRDDDVEESLVEALVASEIQKTA